MIRVENVLMRREIRAHWLTAHGETSIIIWQTQVDDGGWRINGLTVGENYYRPSKTGSWPRAVPAPLIVAIVQLDPNANNGTVSPSG